MRDTNVRVPIENRVGEENDARAADVADAPVLGLPDARLGAVPVAAVEARAGRTLDPAALEEFARARLVPYMVPARFVVVESLPRTPSMKISRPGVRALFGTD